MRYWSFAYMNGKKYHTPKSLKKAYDKEVEKGNRPHITYHKK